MPIFCSDFERLGRSARYGIIAEVGLLVGIGVSTLVLSALLYETRAHLSTATILFVVNILVTNALFVASFVCLFSETAAATIADDDLQQHFEEVGELYKETKQGCRFRSLKRKCA